MPSLVVFALALAATYTGLTLLDDPRQQIAATAALWMASTVLCFAAFIHCRRFRWTRRCTVTLFVTAAAFRIVMCGLAPTLSNDFQRYLWDGRLIAIGEDPYLSTPAAWLDRHPASGDARAESMLAGMNSPNYATVYPPVSQTAFTASWSISAASSDASESTSIVTLRLLFTAADLLALFLMSRWLTTLGRSNVALLLWAWHPLPIVELIGAMHSEALLITPLVAAGWLTATHTPHRWRCSAAGVAVAFAVGVKLFPVLLLAPLARLLGVWGTIAAAVAIAVLLFPMLRPEAAANIRGSLDLYHGTFQFNHAGFRLGLLLFSGDDPGAHYRFLSQAFRVALLTGLAGLTVIGWRSLASDRSAHPRARTVTALFAATLGLYLITHTTLHPWYLAWVLWLLPVFGRYLTAFAWLSFTSVLSYTAYAQTPIAVPAGILALEWGVFLPLLLLDLRRYIRDTASRSSS